MGPITAFFDMEKANDASDKSPIETVAPTVLLELLLNHSDIKVPAVTSLACTSTGFSKALDELWPYMMSGYAKTCQQRPTTKPQTHKIPAEYLQRVYPPLNQICIVRASTRLRGAGYDLSFAFQEDVSQWTRQEALMTRHIARYMYFLATADLERLDVYNRIFGERCYRFEDVLAAGMLRYGRRPYLERLLQRPVRRLLRDEKSAIRLAKARQVRQQLAVPGIPLDEGLLWTYAKEYVRTGAGMEGAQDTHLLAQLVRWGCGSSGRARGVTSEAPSKGVRFHWRQDADPRSQQDCG